VRPAHVRRVHAQVTPSCGRTATRLRGFNRIRETVISAQSVRTAQRYQKLAAGPCGSALLCGRATTTKKAHEDERRPRGCGGSPRSCLVGRTLPRAAPRKRRREALGIGGGGCERRTPRRCCRIESGEKPRRISLRALKGTSSYLHAARARRDFARQRGELRVCGARRARHISRECHRVEACRPECADERSLDWQLAACEIRVQDEGRVTPLISRGYAFCMRPHRRSHIRSHDSVAPTA
jgi:hypothetical protein